MTSARRLLKRSFRSSDRAFLAEGPQSVREAVALAATRPGLVQDIFATGDARRRHRDIVDAAESLRIPTHPVGDEVMASLAQTVTPQGMVAVCSFLDRDIEDVAAVRPSLVAVLAHVRDPGNAGTVIRAADAAGADAVALTTDSVDPYNGKCVRATAGSLFHLPIAMGRDAMDTIVALRAPGLSVVAADSAGDLDLDEAIESGLLTGRTAWIFGNEAWGLPPETRELADHVVRVPIYGRAESLNLATAAAVCLYASARAQRSVPQSST
ncbi:MAG: RNA methyltransferase [Candidatus Nanopelagicales bacterium]